MQRMGREIREHLLELTKGQSALVKVLICLRGLQAEAADKFIATPVFPFFVYIIILIVLRFDKMQIRPGVIHPLLQVGGHRADVFHQALRVVEHILVHPLQNIFHATFRNDLECVVDMSAAVGRTGNRGCINAECINCLLHHTNHDLHFFICTFGRGQKSAQRLACNTNKSRPIICRTGQTGPKVM